MKTTSKFGAFNEFWLVRRLDRECGFTLLEQIVATRSSLETERFLIPMDSGHPLSAEDTHYNMTESHWSGPFVTGLRCNHGDWGSAGGVLSTGK